MIWSLIGRISGKVFNIVEDKDEANRLKFEIQRQLIENKSNELEASAKIVLVGPLEKAGDIEGQGQYWKTHYNTPLGKGAAIYRRLAAYLGPNDEYGDAGQGRLDEQPRMRLQGPRGVWSGKGLRGTDHPPIF
jgi:hypothetical protein